MAYVDKGLSKIGTDLKVVIRKKDVDIKITKMPFLEAKYFRKKVDEEAKGPLI